jgi:hypothetical protein
VSVTAASGARWAVNLPTVTVEGVAGSVPPPRLDP